MNIDVLGTGCPRCKKLFALVEETVCEAGVVAVIRKVEKLDDIMNYGVMMTPALAVDGQVVAAGRIPAKEEIKKWIGAAGRAQ